MHTRLDAGAFCGGGEPLVAAEGQSAAATVAAPSQRDKGAARCVRVYTFLQERMLCLDDGVGNALACDADKNTQPALDPIVAPTCRVASARGRMARYSVAADIGDH